MNMKKIAIVANCNITEKLSAAMGVAKKIEDRVDVIYIPEAYRDRIMRSRNHNPKFQYRTTEDIYSESDLVIAIGGDGVMLEAARRATPTGTPILGINMGRVGYMTELEMTELDLLDKIFDGEYHLDERAMLRVEIRSSRGQTRFSAYALNEAVIAKGATARIIDLELSDNGRLVSEYRADGLVVATPTGSTAYSLSAGGPIIDPKLSCFCVTPICPHSLVSRPFIFPDDAEIEIKNVCQREKVLFLTLDGKSNYEIAYGDIVKVTKLNLYAKLVRLKDNDFYNRFRAKMISN